MNFLARVVGEPAPFFSKAKGNDPAVSCGNGTRESTALCWEGNVQCGAPGPKVSGLVPEGGLQAAGADTEAARVLAEGHRADSEASLENQAKASGHTTTSRHLCPFFILKPQRTL